MRSVKYRPKAEEEEENTKKAASYAIMMIISNNECEYEKQQRNKKECVTVTQRTVHVCSRLILYVANPSLMPCFAVHMCVSAAICCFPTHSKTFIRHIHEIYQNHINLLNMFEQSKASGLA